MACFLLPSRLLRDLPLATSRRRGSWNVAPGLQGKPRGVGRTRRAQWETSLPPAVGTTGGPAPHPATVRLLLLPTGLVLRVPPQEARTSQPGLEFLLRTPPPMPTLRLGVELGWPQAVGGLGGAQRAPQLGGS